MTYCASLQESLPSLRGAKRRSNPDFLRGPGLLRVARNDGLPISHRAARAEPLLHHRGGLAEQNPALLLGAIDGLAEIRIDLLRLGVGALGRGTDLDRFQPALQVRKLLDVLALVLVRHHP